MDVPRNRLKESVSSVLANSLRLLILDDEAPVCDALMDHFSDFPLFQIFVSRTQRHALDLFETEGPFHVCLYDLSVTDMNNDGYFLLKRFHRKTSFIVVTGSHSPRAGGESRDMGAKEILEKATLTAQIVRQEVSRWAIINILYPEHNARESSTISRTVEALFVRNPENVDEWMRYVGIDDSAFRKMWRARGIQPKQALAIYKLLSGAVRLYDTDSPRDIRREKEYESNMDYFLAHRSALAEIIRKKRNN